VPDQLARTYLLQPGPPGAARRALRTLAGGPQGRRHPAPSRGRRLSPLPPRSCWQAPRRVSWSELLETRRSADPRTLL